MLHTECGQQLMDVPTNQPCMSPGQLDAPLKMSIESARHRSHHPPLHLCNCFLERLHSRQWQHQLGSQEENTTIRPYLAEKSSIRIDISIILMSQQTWHLDMLSRKCSRLTHRWGRPSFIQTRHSVTLKGQKKNLAELQI